jgi:hypothetical protein
MVCAGFGVAIVAGAPAFADAPVPGALSPASAPAIAAAGRIGQEQTVQNWILCTSEANAESIAQARAGGVEPALKIYADLQSTKACGVFPVLRVILQQSLYESPAGDTHQTRVYRASVSIGEGWPTGFVISGGLAD